MWFHKGNSLQKSPERFNLEFMYICLYKSGLSRYSSSFLLFQDCVPFFRVHPFWFVFFFVSQNTPSFYNFYEYNTSFRTPSSQIFTPPRSNIDTKNGAFLSKMAILVVSMLDFSGVLKLSFFGMSS